MGTRFIAARESMASDAYRQMLVDSTMDDVILTKAFTGLEASMLRPSILAACLDPAKLDESVSQERAMEAFGNKSGGPRRWSGVWSSGHSVSAVHSVMGAAELIDEIAREYEASVANSDLVRSSKHCERDEWSAARQSTHDQ
jgi:nitronate monooxygenase